MKTVVTKFLSVIFLFAICSCGESRKETQVKALSELRTAAFERGVKKYYASERDALPNQIAEYEESLAEFSRAKRKCKDLGIEDTAIDMAEIDANKQAEDLIKKIYEISD